MPLIPLFLAQSNERNISFAITEESDVVACSIDVDVSSSLATVESDDIVAVSLDADVSVSLSAVEQDDIVSVTLDNEAVVTEVTTTGRSKKKRGYRQIEYVSPIVPELLKEEPVKKKKKETKSEKAEQPKVISETWSKKEGSKEVVGSLADRVKEVQDSVPKKQEPEFDFAAMERELTAAMRRRQIEKQNELLMILAMEE